jgi:release factor glutamine methyltransferase
MEPGEARMTARYLLEWVLGLEWADTLGEAPVAWTPEAEARLAGALERLLAHEPLQYVTGRAWFCERIFQVGPAVLIPRPETEELVYHIVADHQPPQPAPIRLVDVGTGSGCIPVSLELIWQAAGVQAEGVGLDISQAALAIAAANAAALGAQTTFQELDIFRAQPGDYAGLDLLVSNPPYIPPQARPTLAPRVQAYEPHLALFTPADDPLAIYRQLALLAMAWLKPGGRLYLEIYEDLGPDTRAVVQAAGLVDVTLRQDLSGRDRFISARRQIF